jgi:uncharacterized protein (TIGR02145 family)
MKKTIIFIIILLLLVAACAYYNCMQKEKFELEKKEAVAAAIKSTIDSLDLREALEIPKQEVLAHKPLPPPSPKAKTKPKPVTEVEKPNLLVDERDGQEYLIFESGNGRWWMAQNLNFKTPGSWCYDLEDAKCAEWGSLYTWDEALLACPEGWHLPNDLEWTQLIRYYGGVHYAGKSLKPGGASGFNALMSGYRDKAGFYGKINESAYFWSSTTQNDDYASFKGLYKSVDNIGAYTYTKPDGMSVRCVKDN